MIAIFLIMTIFGLLLSISSVLMLAAYDTHENLKISLIIIGIVLTMSGGIATIAYRSIHKETHTVIITVGGEEETYINSEVEIYNTGRMIEIVIEKDGEQIVYINPDKYEVK